MRSDVTPGQQTGAPGARGGGGAADAADAGAGARRWLPALTVFRRLLAAFLLTSLVPLLATWYIARQVTLDNAEHLAESQLRYEASQIAGRTDGWLQLNFESLAEHADTILIRSMDAELQRSALIDIVKHQPWTVLAFTINPDGMSLARSDNLQPINYSDREYFKTAISGQPLGQQMAISRTTHRPSWIFGIPIKDTAGNVRGVIAKTCGLSELTDQLLNSRIGQTGRALLISFDGKLAAMTGSGSDEELRDFSRNPVYLARESRSGLIRFMDGDKPTVAVVEPVRFGWLIAVQMEEAEALRAVKETDRTMMILLLVAVLLSAAFAAVVAPTLSNPLVRLTQIADDISRGRFHDEIPGVDRSDEIGALARSVERMSRSLRIAMDRLTSRALK